MYRGSKPNATQRKGRDAYYGRKLIRVSAQKLSMNRFIITKE